MIQTTCAITIGGNQNEKGITSTEHSPLNCQPSEKKNINKWNDSKSHAFSCRCRYVSVAAHLIACTQPKNWTTTTTAQMNEWMHTKMENKPRINNPPANSAHEFIFHIWWHQVVSHFDSSLSTIYSNLIHFAKAIDCRIICIALTKIQPATKYSINTNSDFVCHFHFFLFGFHVFFFFFVLFRVCDISIDFLGYRNGKRLWIATADALRYSSESKVVNTKIPLNFTSVKNIDTQQCKNVPFLKESRRRHANSTAHTFIPCRYLWIAFFFPSPGCNVER